MTIDMLFLFSIALCLVEKGINRAAYFTDAEKVLLTDLELVEKNINIIHAKPNSSITNLRKKQALLDGITKQLNARGGHRELPPK